MDIRLCVTVIRTAARKSRLWRMSVISVHVSVHVAAVGSLHVLDLCLQQCLCVRMHYGPVHDYIQWQRHSSTLAIIVRFAGVRSFLSTCSGTRIFSVCGCAVSFPFIVFELVDRVSIWPHWCSGVFLIKRRARTSESKKHNCHPTENPLSSEFLSIWHSSV